MARTSDRVAGTAFVTAGAFFAKVLFQAYYILLARILGAPRLGIYFLSIAIVTIGADVVSFVNNNTFVKYGGIFYSDRDWSRLSGLHGFGFAAVASAGCIGAIVCILAAGGPLESLFSEDALSRSLPYLALSLPLIPLLTQSGTLLITIQRPLAKVVLGDLMVPFLLLVSLPPLMMLTIDPLVYVSWSFSIATAVAVITSTIVLHRHGVGFRGWRQINVRLVVRYSMTTYAMSNLNNLTRWGGIILVGLFLNSKEVGVLGIANQGAQIIAVIIRPVISVFGPLSAGLFNLKKLGRLFDAYSLSTKWAVTIALFLFSTWLVVGRELIHLAFGAEFSAAYLPLIILSVGSVVQAATNGASTVLTTTGFETRELMNVAIGGLITALLTLVLIQEWGIIGAATGGVVASIIVQLMRVTLLRKLFERRLFDFAFMKPFIAALVSSLCLFAVRPFVGRDLLALPVLPLVMILNLSVFVSTLHVLGWTPADREMFRRIRRVILPRPRAEPPPI